MTPFRALCALALALVVLLLTLPASAARGSTWRIAVVIYNAVDADCNGTRLTRTIAPAEVEEGWNLLLASVASVQGFSRGGGGQLAATRIDAGSMTSADTTHGGCWPSPGNLRAMGDWPAGYDSVYVLHPITHGFGGFNWNCGACADEDGDGIGSTYAAQPIWDGDADYIDHMDYGHFIFIHEWGNAVSAFYRQAGFAIPPNDLYSDQSKYRFTNWYPDYFSGRLREIATNRWVGLTAKVWGYGTPTAKQR